MKLIFLSDHFVFAGMEGERPARLNRGEADRDAYRRSAAPRTYSPDGTFHRLNGLVYLLWL